LRVWQARFQPPTRKNQRWIGIFAPRQAYPPANQFAAIKCAKSASADFRNAPIPNPRRRVLRVWQARFQPPARKKSAMDRDCRPPPVPTYPPANQFAAIKCAKSAGEQKSAMDRDCCAPRLLPYCWQISHTFSRDEGRNPDSPWGMMKV